MCSWRRGPRRSSARTRTRRPRPAASHRRPPAAALQLLATLPCWRNALERANSAGTPGGSGESNASAWWRPLPPWRWCKRRGRSVIACPSSWNRPIAAPPVARLESQPIVGRRFGLPRKAGADALGDRRLARWRRVGLGRRLPWVGRRRRVVVALAGQPSRSSRRRSCRVSNAARSGSASIGGKFYAAGRAANRRPLAANCRAGNRGLAAVWERRRAPGHHPGR